MVAMPFDKRRRHVAAILVTKVHLGPHSRPARVLPKAASMQREAAMQQLSGPPRLCFYATLDAIHSDGIQHGAGNVIPPLMVLGRGQNHRGSHQERQEDFWSRGHLGSVAG